MAGVVKLGQDLVQKLSSQAGKTLWCRNSTRPTDAQRLLQHRDLACNVQLIAHSVLKPTPCALRLRNLSAGPQLAPAVDLWAHLKEARATGARLAPRSTLCERPLMNQNWRPEGCDARVSPLNLCPLGVTKAVTPTNIARCLHRIWVFGRASYYGHWGLPNDHMTCCTRKRPPRKKFTRVSPPQNWYGPYSQARDAVQQRSSPWPGKRKWADKPQTRGSPSHKNPIGDSPTRSPQETGNL